MVFIYGNFSPEKFTANFRLCIELENETLCGCLPEFSTQTFIGISRLKMLIVIVRNS